MTMIGSNSNPLVSLSWNIFLFLPVLLPFTQEELVQNDPEVVRLEIKEQWKDFARAWEAEEASACAAFYAEDAVNIPPGSEMRKGRQSIQEFYQFLFDQHLNSAYQHTTESIEVSEHLAVEMGHFEVDWIRNDSTEWTFNARCMVLWKKNPDAEWEISRFIFNQAE